jgi:DNA topoisomerase-1
MAGKQKVATGTGISLVIVESPTKANTIKKYLGANYIVEASVGHVRDLVTKKTDLPANDPRRAAPWVQYGVNIDNHFEPLEEVYLVPPEKKRQVDALKAALAKADTLYLATDDDREGEAISWHLLQVLNPKVPVKRLVFHEITKDAIHGALEHTRAINDHLVSAQRTRRVVDRLFGWDVSEVLWRKIKPGLSAGRVQSVALRLLVERERERMAFISANFWDVLARLSAQNQSFDATLQRLGDKRIATGKDFDDNTGKLTAKDALVLNGEMARLLCARIDGQPARVLTADVKPQTLKPSPPFTTSTLQQEANRKLRFNARQTMQVAQKLYENGFITYMRTDSVTLSEQAILAARETILAQFGEKYLPPQARRYQTKTANAQEAHEAIRPAGTHFPALSEVERTLGRDGARLYELIWKRTIASQMLDAQVEQTTVDIGIVDAVFRASGRTTRFAGYLRVYGEETDESDDEKKEEVGDRALPLLKAGDVVGWGAKPNLEARGHDTRPPARLTDASLVKGLEEKGIGRPSTYAAILQNLIDKGYCFRKGNALVATFMGMAVTQMLERHMPHLVDYSFTAKMEDRLDAIARGEDQAGIYLRDFYENGFSEGLKVTRGLTDMLADVRDQIDPAQASSVPIGKTEGGEDVVVRIGRFGTFLKVGERTANVPEDLAPDELTVAKALSLVEEKARGEAPLANDPVSGLPIFVRTGRFGPYLQLGVAVKDAAEKPKMVSLSKGMLPEKVTLEQALLQLQLPKTLGKDPTSGEPIVATVGRYGDYVKCGDESRTLPTGCFAATVSFDEAVNVLRQPKSVAGKTHIRDIGVRESDGKMIAVWQGRFGRYVTDGTTNKTLPPTAEIETLTVAGVEALLAAAAEARAGKLIGVDPESKAEIRLIDGRFGPYLTNGAVNASLERGMGKDEVTVEIAVDRLRDYGKAVKAKTKGRGGRTSAAKAPAGKKTAAAKTTSAARPAAKKPSAKKPAKAPPKKDDSAMISARSAKRAQAETVIEVVAPTVSKTGIVRRPRA